MRGSMFLAVALIVIGLILIIAAFRGRAAQLLDVFIEPTGASPQTASSSGTAGTRQSPRGQRPPRGSR